MAMYPGSTPRLISTKYLSGAAMAVYNRVNLHVAVSESSSLFNQFNQSGQASSHFYVRRDGSSEQYVDTSLQAEADLDGNDATISIETQGGVNDADNEPWTDAQLTALAQIFAWAMATHGIRNQLASSSQTNDSSKGLSWHRLGIDGNFPSLPNPCAGRGQRGGGMKYSSSGGKLCPGCGKINQIPEIFARAGGGGTPQPPNPPNPPSGGRLVVDQSWGAETTKWMQRTLVSTDPIWADGVISHQWKDSSNQYIWAAQFDKTQEGSALGKAIQNRLVAVGLDPGSVDGLIGKSTILALQHYYNTGYYDGVISKPTSALVAAMQNEINAGTFLGVPVPA